MFLARGAAGRAVFAPIRDVCEWREAATTEQQEKDTRKDPDLWEKPLMGSGELHGTQRTEVGYGRTQSSIRRKERRGAGQKER